MMHQEIFLESENLKLQIQTWGAMGKYPPILALHGLMDNSASFEPLAKLLGEHYIFAPDLVGHGYSSHLPMNMLYSLETHVLIVSCILDQLKWKNFSIIGHSLGAGIGLALATLFPQRITGITILDTLGPPAQSKENYLEQFLLNMQSRLVTQTETQSVYTTKEEAIQIRSLMSTSSLETARLLAERDLKQISGGFISRCDRRLHFKSHRSYTEEQWQMLLRAVECPVLLVKAQSGILTDSDLQQRKDCFKDLKIVEVAGGHHAHMEAPTLVSLPISQFLNRNHYAFLP